MKTTDLFVELLVIGVGASAWVLIALATTFDAPLGAFSGLMGSIATTIPLLAVVYLLGILTDRLADRLFSRVWADSMCKDRFGSTEAYYQVRNASLIHSERFALLFDYSRSRQRICRGWSVNAVLTWVALMAWAYSRVLPAGVAPTTFVAAATVALWTLSIGCWLTWRSMFDTELKRVKDQERKLNESCPSGS